MKLRNLKRIGLALTAALALAACGNGNKDATEALKRLPKALFAKRTAPQPITPQQMAQALSASTSSVFLFEFESRKAQILLSDIQRNGPYQTFGNVARQVVVLRQGMITSTRGFGGDLMSTEEDQLLAHVSHRTEGRASYDMRFLTPEDVTLVRRYSCHIVPGGQVPVAAGLVQETGYAVNATCTAADGISSDFTNTYVVARDGYILTAKQWVGPYHGYVLSQALRR